MVKSKTKLNRRKLVAMIIMFLVIVLTLIAVANQSKLIRLYRAITLFEPAVIEENFRSIEQLFDTRIVQKSTVASQFLYDLKELPEFYTYQGETKKISEFIEHTHTTGMIVVRNDTILFEKYFRGNSASTRTISWSVSKSIVSALLGIALAEGNIEDLNQQVTDYLPSLRGSGYDGARIIDVLQMSSGVRFNEDYSDFFSDINRMSRVFALNSPLEKFVTSLESEREPGTYNKYVSMDTQVLGMVIMEATGKTLSEYMEEKLWQPAGMESDASWLIDSAGVEAAFGGLNAVLRDYARFGCLYLNMGHWNGKQILPAAWVTDSVTPKAPHLLPGNNPNSEWVLGYGYQWWIPENPDGDYLAIGIYGQAIYIYPRYNIIIAKTSAYPGYDDDGEEMELESIEFFRTIAREIF